MDDLVVNNQFTSTVVDDEGTDTSTAIAVGLTDALEKTALGDDGEALLDITGLGHGGDETIVMDIEDTVSLVDRSKHGLDNNRGGRVGDEAGLFMKLTSEEINTEVAVLASLGRDGDTDHLARTSLEDEEITHTDEVNGNGNTVLARDAAARLDDTDLLASTRSTALNNLLTLTVVERMKEAVGSTLDAAAEGVVVTFVVVVTHFGLGGFFTDSLLGYRNLSSGVESVAAFRSDVVGVGTVSSSLGLVATVVSNVDLVGGLNTTAEVAFSNVKLGLVGPVLSDGSGGRGRILFVTTNRFAEAFAGKFYLRVVLLFAVVEAVTLFVDASLLVASMRTAVVGADANVNFFLSVDTGVGKRSTSSIFPSDARSGFDVNLSFYSSLSSLRDSVTPVRRREDTEGDGYARLKVQIDCPLGVLSRMPFELLKTTRKVDKKRLDWEGKSFIGAEETRLECWGSSNSSLSI